MTKYIVYKELKVFKTRPGIDYDLSYQDKLFVELDFRANKLPDFIIGEVDKLYIKDYFIMADICLHFNLLIKNRIIDVELLTPAIALSINNCDAKVNRLSLGVYNEDSEIKNLRKQLELI